MSRLKPSTLDIVIVGAGPYGLSLAAHLRAAGAYFRIFGRPMESWSAHMPKGMLLKSDGFATNISDPADFFTLKRYCAENGIAYHDTNIRVRLEIFADYGRAFRDRMVPELEEKMVDGLDLDRASGGFLLRLDDGEIVATQRVVLAVGITHFDYVPPNLAHLPPEFLSHSSRHHDLECFRGRSVVVIGGGASASDLAGLLRDVDAEVQLVARRPSLKFDNKPPAADRPRSWWRRIRHPQSGLGPGLRSRFYADAPLLFHYLPEALRLAIVETHLGPKGGWFAREKLAGRVPLLLGYSPERAQIEGGKVRLKLGGADGTEREVLAEHVISATGYRVDMKRLKFLSSEIQSRLKTCGSAPALSANFESSIPGLFFTGVAAATSFGPVMRFAFGARFAARRLSTATTRPLFAWPGSRTTRRSFSTR
jgi:hypothetical protein